MSAIKFLDLAAQQARLGDGLSDRVAQVFGHCQFVMGPEVAELENMLAGYSGAHHAIAVSSGTDALLIVMMAEKIGPGMAVFLPAFTYTATAEIVLLLGATPVFVDSDPETFQISLESLATRLEDVKHAGNLQPRAILGVDLFGQPASWDELRDFAQQHKLSLIADCAQSFGASYKGRKLGREALATTLSFFPSKPLGCYGDGGAILTDNTEKAALYRSLRSHGEGRQRYDVQHIGLNARLDTIQAAVLLAKMEIFEEELNRREAIATYYDSALPSLVKKPVRVAYSSSTWAVYCVILSNQEQRDSLRDFLADRNIPTSVYYPRPLHWQPAYQACHDGSSLKVSERLCGQVLALPLHPYLSDDVLGTIAESVNCWAAHGRVSL